MAHPSTPSDFEQKVVVLINGAPEMHLDRRIPLSDTQKQAVAQLEAKLNAGFKVAGVHYKDPNALQRAQFAASMIPEALQRGDEAQAGLVLALIGTSLPDLKQIQYRHRRDGGWDIAFISDRCYEPDERPIRLVPPKPS